MILYHRTTIAEARAVMEHGFADQKWGFELEGLLNERRLKVLGVWLTDRVLQEGDGPPGDAVLEVTVTGDANALQPFEVPGVLPGARLWVVPATLLNQLVTVRIHSVDPRTSWWFERDELSESGGNPME